MARIWKYPELLFIALVLVAPFPAAFFWSNSSLAFLLRLLVGGAAGLVIWLVIIALVVWPRYRGY